MRIEDFIYDLPDDLIARHPLNPRDHSRLLHLKADGKINHHQYFELSKLLVKGDLLVFNNTKVINARIVLQRASGARIEVFLLQPVLPSSDIQILMQATSECVWECMIGNLKKWKNDERLHLSIPRVGSESLDVYFDLISRNERHVRISWNDDKVTFAELSEMMGEIPLPPYLNREVEDEDQQVYQTVYSKEKGAVAAPTAGLHFTDRLLNELKDMGVNQQELTLHVSAGTFKPVTAENPEDHDMHVEQIKVSRENVESLHSHQNKRIIAVGTTSLRTLESLYWWASLLAKEPERYNKLSTLQLNKDQVFEAQKWHDQISRDQAVEQLLAWMDLHEMETIRGQTGIYILPPYQVRMGDGILTNFHQPGSTLIMLMSALIGDQWRGVYEEAIKEKYRFLSFGDACFFEW
ncbi:MAG: S-adenosylmethionine:tRNA ribosyltransferase-isomerase [Cyclobacteriaceae bacterium]|nr:S-adenosylmethionine:tRNA ribosyltransferase-isomerase [Cyclobacteriaceae bacterium]MCH8517085.1 S-adenosylmethionine:tRNA ribosyltransferase-isomerase [Cyclobacteriaceae bacterium]